jgi:hypothetical protein
LALVSDDLNVEATAAGAATALLTSTDSGIDELLDVTLKTSTEILVESATARENNVLVKTAANIDGRLLNDAVDDDGERRKEVGAIYFGVEEDLGGEKALVANVNGDLATARLRYNVLGEAGAVTVVPCKFLHNIRAHVAVLLFDLLSCLEGRVGFATIAEKRLDKVGDVATSDGNGLDGRTNDVALSDGNNVSDTVTRVDDSAGQ